MQHKFFNVLVNKNKICPEYKEILSFNYFALRVAAVNEQHALARARFILNCMGERFPYMDACMGNDGNGEYCSWFSFEITKEPLHCVEFTKGTVFDLCKEIYGVDIECNNAIKEEYSFYKMIKSLMLREVDEK